MKRFGKKNLFAGVLALLLALVPLLSSCNEGAETAGNGAQDVKYDYPGEQCIGETESDTEGLYVLAATDGSRYAMMISNLTGERQELQIEGAALCGARYYVIDNERLLSWAPNAGEIGPNTVILIEW